MLSILIKFIGIAFLAFVAVFLIYLLVLTIVYTVKHTIKELKGGEKNDRNPKP